VRSRHAHAWIEVAYDGAGWVTYDPTPAEAVEVSAADLAEAQADDAAAEVRAAESLLFRHGWLALLLLIAAVAGLVSWAVGTRRLGERVRLVTLARHGVPSTELLADRARFFGILEARGFELGGPETPAEWLADWPAEEALREAVSSYTYLRFSGQEPPERVAAFRRSLDRLR
jgi:hypothetical protein